MVHLFVAEDSKLIKKVIKTIIEEHAAEVIESTDNMEKIAEFEQNKSEVTFLDIQLPDEQGLGAIYDIIESIPEAKVDVFRTDLKDQLKKTKPVESEVSKPKPVPAEQLVIKKKEIINILDIGMQSAIESITTMLNKELKLDIISENITKKDGVKKLVPETSLGVFYEISGDVSTGTSLMFPLKDILAVVSIFQIDFTIEEGTTQNIINELGNIFIQAILGIMDEKIRKQFSLGPPIPANGNNLEQHLMDVGRTSDDCIVIKFRFMADDKEIDTYLVLSVGRILS